MAGKKLAEIGDRHRRRLSDFKNAWRKMSPGQRAVALAWMATTGPEHPIAQTPFDNRITRDVFVAAVKRTLVCKVSR